MRVALDAQLAVGTATGIGEYVCGLAAALRRRGVDLQELCDPRLDPWRFDRRVMWDQLLLPRHARRSGAVLLHCTAGTMPRHAGMPVVVTVHDLAWHHVQQHVRPYARYYFGSFSLRRYREAAAVLVDSKFTRDELLELLPGFDAARVAVIYPGVASDYAALQRHGDARTILAVGTVERRKNLSVLIRALPRLAGARLLAIGPQTSYAAECIALAAQLRVADRVELRGYVEREELLELYASAAAAAVPSTYEGFGYAAAQALCAGLPCVVAGSSSLPEVVGDDARVVDPHDDGAWAAALAQVMSGADDARAARVRTVAAERFSWETSAAQVECVYASLVDR